MNIKQKCIEAKDKVKKCIETNETKKKIKKIAKDNKELIIGCSAIICMAALILKKRGTIIGLERNIELKNNWIDGYKYGFETGLNLFAKGIDTAMDINNVPLELHSKLAIDTYNIMKPTLNEIENTIRNV